MYFIHLIHILDWLMQHDMRGKEQMQQILGDEEKCRMWLRYVKLTADRCCEFWVHTGIT